MIYTSGVCKTMFSILIFGALTAGLGRPVFAQRATWTSKGSLLTPRAATAAVGVNGMPYVMAESTDAVDITPALDAYDPITDSWSTKVPMPIYPSHGQPSSRTVPQAASMKTYGQLPLTFETNRGQTDPSVKFLSRGKGYSLFLTPTAAVLALLDSAKPMVREKPWTDLPQRIHRVLRIGLAGANSNATISGVDSLPGVTNYFIGNDPAKWSINVPTFAKVKYEMLYPGIDLIYYGKDGQLETDWMVSPGSDPGAITLAFGGAEKVSVETNGDLLLSVGASDIRLRKPITYQFMRGIRHEVASRYELKGRKQVSFRIGAYDHTQPLVIDPVLVYSTYFGGTSQENGDGGIAVDSSGNAYISGLTDSADFPTTSGAYQTNFRGFRDIFVTKLNPTGSVVVYSTYLGGSGGEDGGGVAVDSAGNLYVVGQTNSVDFPTTIGAFQTAYGGGSSDGVVAKLNAMGSALLYSTYLGGSGEDHALGIALDGSGNAYVAGNTESSDFPTTFGAFQTVFGGAGGHVFVSKLNAAGSALLYSTFLGGNGAESSAHGVGVDSSGNVHIAGSTNSTTFPTLNAFQNGFAGGGNDGFIATLNAAGSGLVYSTYIGGSGDDFLNALASDSAGNTCVTGTTTSSNFPTTSGAYQTALAGGSYDAVVAKLNPAGSPVYSTYLGGGNYDSGIGVALDGAGNTYVAGQTYSSDFPTTNAFQSTFGGTYDGFVTELNSNGSALIYSSYLGGSGGDAAQAVAVKSVGETYVLGTTGSTDFPTADPIQAANAGSLDLFVAKIGVYAASVQQPINSDGSSIFNATRGIVPVKFTLTLGGLPTCSLPAATISLTRTAGPAPGPIDESVYTASADTGSNFRISNCQYVYNLSSKALGPGTYEVDISIDGAVGNGVFALK